MRSADPDPGSRYRISMLQPECYTKLTAQTDMQTKRTTLPNLIMRVDPAQVGSHH